MKDPLQLIKSITDDLSPLRNIFITNYYMLKMVYDLVPDDVVLLVDTHRFKTTTELKNQIKKTLVSQGSLFLETDNVQKIIRDFENNINGQARLYKELENLK
jgi:hypothetical protein